MNPSRSNARTRMSTPLRRAVRCALILDAVAAAGAAPAQDAQMIQEVVVTGSRISSLVGLRQAGLRQAGLRQVRGATRWVHLIAGPAAGLLSRQAVAV